ncbi:MAG TPA: MFS transporter [Nocardioidaceae bacterium]|nr:MFS transporter [Nocardioidaceae bacterium]
MPITQRFRGRYGMAVAIALLGLCPNIVLSTAFLPLSQVISADLGASQLQLGLAEGLSNAGYAFGAVLAAQLAQRYVQRRLFLWFEGLFVVGSLLATAAPGIGLFFAGRLLQGSATGFMLISALPPLVTRFGVGKLPGTVAIVNIGLFGASTLGPLVGGVTAAFGAWRLLLLVITLLGAAGFVVALLGYVEFEPQAPELPVDKTALSLALAATVLPFFATSMLAGASLSAPVVLVPFLLGLAALVALVVVQYRKQNPLMPVRALSSQLPVTGTVVAMLAGAVFVTVLELTQLYLVEVAGQSPLDANLQFWPMPLGLLVAAVIFGALVRTRYLALLVLAGLVALAGGTALLLLLSSSSTGAVVTAASLLLGFGAGATVSPGLFLAAFGVPASRMGRAFALVELLRSEAAYAVTPLVVYVAESLSTLSAGITVGLLAMLALAGVALVAALAIPALSGARLRKPDLEAWLEEGGQALASPTTVAHLRPRVEDEVVEPLLPPRLRRPRRARRRRRG